MGGSTNPREPQRREAAEHEVAENDLTRPEADSSSGSDDGCCASARLGRLERPSLWAAGLQCPP